MLKISKKILTALISLSLGSSCLISAKMSDPPGSIEQQKGMIKYFEKKIKKYVENFDIHDLAYKCNYAVEKFDRSNGFVPNQAINFEKFLQSYKDYDLENKLWNCRVGSSVLLNYLEKNQIRCAYVHIFDFILPAGLGHHDVIVYSVLTDDKEKWFVADPMSEVFVNVNKKVLEADIVDAKHSSKKMLEFHFNNQKINDNLKRFYNILDVASGDLNQQQKFIDMSARYIQGKVMGVNIPENGQCLALNFFDYFNHRSKFGKIFVYSDEREKILYPKGNVNNTTKLDSWCDNNAKISAPNFLSNSNKFSLFNQKNN